MRITTTKSDLVEALGIANRAVSARSSIQVLSGILLDVGPEGIFLSATDMELSVKAPLRGEVEQPGSLVLPARLLSDIAKSLSPGEVTLEQRQGESQVDVRSGESEFVLRTLPAVDFPQFPVFPLEDSFSISKKGLLETIDRVSLAASRDETRPVLTGVLMHVARTSVKMVATDSYRLAVKETETESTAQGKIQIIVPARALVEVSRLGGVMACEEIMIVPTENQIMFQMGEVALMSRLIDGQFPNYRQLVPETFDYEVEVDREEFVDVVKRVALLAERSAPVRLKFSAGTLTISAQSQDLGRAHESLPIRYEGEELEIGFNPDFLEAGAQAVRDETVRLRFISPLRPGLIKGAGEDFLYLIMPIRLSD